MKRILLLFAVLLFANIARAQESGISFQIGPRVGYDLGDVEEFFIGADARFRTESLPVVINPGFDYYFVDENLTFWSLDVNALYEFGFNNQSFTPYAGLGLIYTNYSIDVDSDILDNAGNSDLGLNIVGGAVFQTGSLKPFAQAKIKVGGDYDLFTIGGGLLFGF